MACQIVEESGWLDLKGFSWNENYVKGSKGAENNREMS